MPGRKKVWHPLACDAVSNPVESHEVPTGLRTNDRERERIPVPAMRCTPPAAGAKNQDPRQPKRQKAQNMAC